MYAVAISLLISRGLTQSLRGNCRKLQSKDDQLVTVNQYKI